MTINVGIIERVLTAGIYETISEPESNRIYQGKNIFEQYYYLNEEMPSRNFLNSVTMDSFIF